MVERSRPKHLTYLSDEPKKFAKFYPEVKIESYDEKPSVKDPDVFALVPVVKEDNASDDSTSTQPSHALSIASIAMALKKSANGKFEQFVHTPTTPGSDTGMHVAGPYMFSIKTDDGMSSLRAVNVWTDNMSTKKEPQEQKVKAIENTRYDVTPETKAITQWRKKVSKRESQVRFNQIETSTGLTSSSRKNSSDGHGYERKRRKSMGYALSEKNRNRRQSEGYELSEKNENEYHKEGRHAKLVKRPSCASLCSVKSAASGTSRLTSLHFEVHPRSGSVCPLNPLDGKSLKEFGR